MRNFIKHNIQFDDFHAQARFELAWRLLLLFLVAVFSLTIFSISTNSYFSNYYICGLAVLLGTKILLERYPLHFKLIMNLLFILLVTLIYISTILVSDTLHFSFPIMIMMISLAAYFVLGNFWGSFYLALDAILFYIYFQILLPDIEEFQHILSTRLLLSISIEFLLVAFTFGFILHHYFVWSRFVDQSQIHAITDLNNKKDDVERQNNEKIVLIQEIHHRVKNNLQVIISLLRMQSGLLDSGEARENFEIAVNRIRTLSLVHQKMYENRSINEINIKEYLEKLTEDLFSAQNPDMDIVYSIDIKLENLDFDRIIALGLILNELIVNSLKYSIQEPRIISVDISNKHNSQFSMIYSDSYFENKDKEEEVIEAQFIDIFIEQLDGNYIKNHKESGIVFTFTLYDK